jgi:hypothetical protein
MAGRGRSANRELGVVYSGKFSTSNESGDQVLWASEVILVSKRPPPNRREDDQPGEWYCMAMPTSEDDLEARVVMSMEAVPYYVKFVTTDGRVPTLHARVLKDAKVFGLREGDGFALADLETAAPVPRALWGPGFGPGSVTTPVKTGADDESSSEDEPMAVQPAGYQGREPRSTVDKARQALYHPEGARQRGVRFGDNGGRGPAERQQRAETGGRGAPPTPGITPEMQAYFAAMASGLASELRRQREGDGGAQIGDAAYGIRGYKTYSAAKKAFEKHPESAMHHVDTTVVESVGPRETLETYLHLHSHTQGCKYAMCITRLATETVEALREEDVPRALGLQAKLLVFVDQVGINGNVDLAWKLTMVRDPPAFLNLKDNFPKMPAAKGTHSTQKSKVARTPLVSRDEFNAALAEMKADEATNDLMEKLDK